MARAIRFNIQVRDSGELKRMKTWGADLTVGIHEKEAAAHHKSSGLTVGQVAEINEFGVAKANIPARPFVRGWADTRARVVVDRIRAAYLAMARAGAYDASAVQDCAEAGARDMKGRITSGAIRPKNAPVTRAKKAPETRPLIETGQLVTSITGNAERRGR